MSIPVWKAATGQSIGGAMSDPGGDLVPITPDNANDLPFPARAIRLPANGTAGTLRITTSAGNVRDTYIAAGEMLTVAVTRVHLTGTAATPLEALV